MVGHTKRASASSMTQSVRSILFGVATSATVVGALLDSDRVQRIAKPFIAPSLAVGLHPRDDAVLIAGLAAATLGDIALIDPDDDATLQRGAGAFAIMQMCYSMLLVRRGARLTIGALVPRLAGWSIAATFLGRRSPAVAQTLASYGLVLTVTSTLAADPGVGRGEKTWAGMVIPTRKPHTWLAAGGVLFLLSDSLIVVRRLFLRGDASRRVAEAVVLTTYAGAQCLLVGGLRK